jgi:hypothetical protein
MLDQARDLPLDVKLATDGANENSLFQAVD